MVSALRHLSAARVSIRTATRAYSEGVVGSGSKAFNEKEKAQEDYFVRQHEKDQLKKLKDDLAKLKKETSDLESSINGLEKK